MANRMEPQNKELERTRSRANGLREPCRSIQCSTHRGGARSTKCIGIPDSGGQQGPGPTQRGRHGQHGSKRATSLDPRLGVPSVFRLGCMIEHRNPGVR